MKYQNWTRKHSLRVLLAEQTKEQDHVLIVISTQQDETAVPERVKFYREQQRAACMLDSLPEPIVPVHILDCFNYPPSQLEHRLAAAGSALRSTDQDRAKAAAAPRYYSSLDTICANIVFGDAP